MIGNFKYLYYKNPVMFRKVGLFLLLHFVSIGLVAPYTLLIQLRYASLKSMLLLNGAGFLIGALILYGFISGSFPVVDVRKRLMFFKGLLMTGRLSVLLLLFFGDTFLRFPLLVLSVFGGTLSYPIINADYQFLMFKSYGLKNRVRLTSANTVVMNLTIIVMNFVSSLVYPRLYLIYLVAVFVDLLAIVSLTGFSGDYSYRVVGKISGAFKRAELEIFSVMFLLQVVLVLLMFIRPVVFKGMGEDSVGFLFGIASILNAVTVHYALHYIGGRRPFIKTGIISMILSVFLFASLQNTYLQVIGVLLVIPLVFTIILGFRHIVFKKSDRELTWGIGAINELLRSLAYIMFIPIGFLGNGGVVSIVYVVISLLFTIGVVAFHLFTKEHHKVLCDA